MTISRHTASVVIDGQRYEPTDLQLTLDEGRVPYASLTATVPLDATTGADLDPRKPRRVQVRLRQDFGDADTLADISADYAGEVIQRISAESAFLGDPSFEQGIAGWEVDPEGSPGSLVHSDEHAHTGTWSMEITGGAAALSVPVEVQPDRSYTTQTWAYGTTSRVDGVMGGLRMAAIFYDSEGTEIDNQLDHITNWDAGVWQRVSMTTDPVTNPDVAYVRLGILPVVFDDDRAWVDDVRFGIAYEHLTAITSNYGRPWNSFGMRASTTRRAILWLRSRDVDHVAATVTILAASGEAMLTDYALAETTPAAPGGTTVRDAVNMVLGRVLDTGVLTPGTGGEEVEPDALPWEPGETAWSYLTSITGSAGLRLWCDELGLWRLQDPETYVAPGGVSMGPQQATLLQDSVNREANGWANSAVVEYRWTDTAGDRHVRYDAFGPGGNRTITRVVERPYPGRGFARAIARKALALGRVIRISAVSDYDIEPLQPATLTLPDAPDQAGIVSAVQWRLPADEMTVRTRDLMSITSDSWLYTVPGRSWLDTPTGTSWDTYDWSTIDG